MNWLLILVLLVLPSVGRADTRTHATNCADIACTTARNGQECYQADTQVLYVCDGAVTTWTDIATASGGGPFLPLGGGIMVGDAIFNDNVNATFGTGSDATISYDNANLLIDPQVVGSGYTDFTDAIMVSVGEDVYSMFGATPVGITPSDAGDRAVFGKTRTVDSTNVKRAALAMMEINTDLALSTPRQNYGLNAFVYTGEANTVSSDRTTGSGAMTGAKIAVRHEAAGTIAMAGGVAAQAQIVGANENGTITSGYAFLDEGGDGGAAGGGITNYYGLWVKDATASNITDRVGVYIEGFENASVDNIAIKIDAVAGANGTGIWFNSSSTLARDGIWWGTDRDTNLYRESANRLKTDDALEVTGDFQSGDATFSSGQVVNYTTVTATSATLGQTDFVTLVDDDSAGSDVTITLPDMGAGGNAGRIYHIKKLGTTADVIIAAAGAQSIDSLATYTLTAQYETLKLMAGDISLGNIWYILSDTVKVKNTVTTVGGSASPTMLGQWYIADPTSGASDTTYTLPAAAAGLHACFQDNGDGAGTVILTPVGDDYVSISGVDEAAATSISNDGTNGNYICVLAVSATEWLTNQYQGTWSS